MPISSLKTAFPRMAHQAFRMPQGGNMDQIRIIFIILFLVSTIPLSGCSTTSTMNGIMSSWECEHINKVMSQWGCPREEQELAGHKRYIWVDDQPGETLRQPAAVGFTSGNSLVIRTDAFEGYGAPSDCVRILEVDDAGYVVDWDWKGDGCPSSESWKYSEWRKNSLPG
jgi:hypothetical protein